MQLFYSNTSPFARKILIALKLLNLESQCELILSNPFENPKALLKVNPLSKIPALVLNNGDALSDSNLILQYLDSISDQASLYPSGENRWQKLQFTQLAEGILTEAVAISIERKRPQTFQHPESIERHHQNILRTLATLAQNLSIISTQTPSILEITLGTALDYLDLRFPEINWRQDWPLFLDWYSIYSQRDEMRKTLPK